MAKMPTYFFLNDLLHRRLYINRPADLMTTWCYPLGKRVTFTYTDALRQYDKAFTTKQVGAMLNRSRDRIELAILDGNISEPQHTYGLTPEKRKYKYMWNEKNIMEAHDWFLTVHRGRPRNDGKITPQQMPSKRELRAIIRQEEMLYVKGEDGEFKPVWRAQDFS